MQSLNLPAADLTIKTDGDRPLVFDIVRRSYVPLTDEEWVRQHFLHFLVYQRGVPAGLIAVEKTFSFQGMPRRADIVVYSRYGKAWLAIECKAPSVAVTQEVFNQVGRYNSVLDAPFVGVTNGLEHYCFTVEGRDFRFLDDFPYFITPKQFDRMQFETYQKEVEVALAAVLEAAKLCQTVQSTVSPELMEKKDRSPVTVADFGSQALVCRAINEAFPDDPVIGEEDSNELRTPEKANLLEKVVGHVSELRPGATTEQILQWIDIGGSSEYADRLWTLDPIDGTKGFLRKQQYAIALGLIVEGKVVVAALACPNLPIEAGSDETGIVFCAVKGEGTQSMPLGSTTVSRVDVSTTSDPSQTRFCESVESGHSSHDDAANVARELGITAQSVRLDSQAKYAIVARGDADVYMRLPTRPGYVEKIWDHAAGMLVIEEAGGTVTDILGNDLDFTHGYGLAKNKGVVASNGHLHDAIIATLKKTGVTDRAV